MGEIMSELFWTFITIADTVLVYYLLGVSSERLRARPLPRLALAILISSAVELAVFFVFLGD
jgi:hypothetical protein